MMIELERIKMLNNMLRARWEVESRTFFCELFLFIKFKLWCKTRLFVSWRCIQFHSVGVASESQKFSLWSIHIVFISKNFSFRTFNVQPQHHPTAFYALLHCHSWNVNSWFQLQQSTCLTTFPFHFSSLHVSPLLSWLHCMLGNSLRLCDAISIPLTLVLGWKCYVKKCTF